MSTVSSIQNKQTVYVDSANKNAEVNRNDKALLNCNVSSVDSADNQTSSVSQISSKRTQQNVDDLIKKVISGTGLTLEEAKAMIEELAKINGKPLTEVDSQTLIKVLTSLKYSIEDSSVNGKLDKTKLKDIFGCYVFLSVKSDKKQVDFDKIRKGMKMSLIQLIKNSNPELKNKKNITPEDVKNTIKLFVKNHMSPEKIDEYKNQPQEAKNILKSLFGFQLQNCTPEEKKLLFAGFLLAIKDADMVKQAPVLIAKLCESIKDDKSKLENFLKKDLRPMLKELLNVDDSTVDNLIKLGIVENLNADNIEELLLSGLNFLRSIEPQELKILTEALIAHVNGQELLDEQMKVLNKHRDSLSQLIGVIAGIAQKPELLKGHEELMAQIQALLEQKGLDKFVYNDIFALYQNNPEYFNNIQTKDDLVKTLNKITDNKFGEAVGDTNPDNLYKENPENNETSSLGLAQRTSSENYMSALMRQNNIAQAINETNKSVKPEFTLIEKTVKTEKPKQNFVQNWTSVTSDELRYQLSNNNISFGDILDNYGDLSDSTQRFVDDMISAMSAGMQTYFLNGIKGKNHVVVAIVKKISADPEKLNLALDYASEKELQRINEQKKFASNKA